MPKEPLMTKTEVAIAAVIIIIYILALGFTWFQTR